MTDFTWTFNEEYNTWDIRAAGVYVWIAPRPPYCDRGHYLAQVDGLDDIDGGDAFPRYFMDLDRAKLEMAEWLAWRLRTREGS